MIKIGNLIKGALCISICLLSFYIFHGITNIFNSLFITLSLGIFTEKMNFSEKSAVYISMVIFTFIFFPLQIIFLGFYIILSLILIYIKSKNLNFIKSYLFLFPIMTFLFTSALYLTDFVFNTQIAKITTDLLGGNIFYFLISITFQAIIISAIVLPLYYSVSKRVAKIRG